MDSLNINAAVEKVLSQTEELKEAATFIDFKMVTFTLSGKDYAIDIMHVKEIAKAGKFTYVPNTLPFVLGVYNLRGEIIPILDLRIFFNIDVVKDETKRMQNLLILSIDDQIFGLVVDKIDKVIGVQKSSIQPPHPLFGDINIKYIDGVVESNNRLYVLLDVLRIFSMKDAAAENADDADEKGVAPKITAVSQQFAQQPVAPKPAAVEKSAPVQAEKPVQAPVQQSAAPVETAPKPAVSEIDIKFIVESLASLKNFNVTDVNETWTKRRCAEWANQRGGNTQLQSSADADEFLKDFWSVHNGGWWSEKYADTVKQLLPPNAAKQIVVWNPGCGKGVETYSLACILKDKYPEAKIKIYAQDIDLLSVSNAGLMSVPAELSQQWYGPYLTKKANNEYTFNADIKDSIMFEYHDCKNTNVLPMVDIIFARDVLSCCDAQTQNVIISDFQEKLKGNGIIIVGDNESLPSNYGFGEKTVGAITAYTKD
ncbi:MAG: chemotaxis protein CheW [Treponema sp.]|nr:chemotaxis protein CheW [Treponema sp.]